MIPEDNFGSEVMANRMHSAGLALEELLVTAQRQDCLTVGIYESAKLLVADPDSVALCVLVVDDEEDIALQIHFTLLQAFCCDSNITILRVSGVQRLQRLLQAEDWNRNTEESGDFHCMLVTNQQADHYRLKELGTYCKESRRMDQWIPELALQDR
ncbi:unnamed protein product [Knipowitschia caucasica]|uniref:Ribosomal protein eL8/eL30/eS12/Gadd45 domain-containing protein n=1 Tax=Knipowitschia caucasica TaxID=637954 RepID=A0AAV2JDS0_KNICA